MIVYLLKLRIRYSDNSIHSRNFTNWDFEHCDVFVEQDKAVSAGRKVMTSALRELKAKIPGRRKESLEVFVENMLELEKFIYYFEIMEFDPNVKRHGWVGTQWKYYTQWVYDYHGALLEKTEWREDLGYDVIAGDEADDAGTKFSVGDFVTVDSRSIRSKDKIFVVASQPGKKTEWNPPEGWENFYMLWSINNYNGFHDHFHETKLRLYEKEVPKDHPLWMLRRLALGELQVDEETYLRLTFYGGILLDYPPEIPSWRTIPELQAKGDAEVDIQNVE